tara:strand:+ start:315 stop:944 length:630 start_codon:yes stop_codon:yes gene_type:complete
MVEENKLKFYLRFSIIAGILFILLGIISIFLREYQYAYSIIIVGFIFILAGSLFKPIIKWKEMPKGMKIIVIILWLGLFSNLWKVYTNFESWSILLGFPLQFPISIIVKPIMIITSLFTLIAIYRKTWWKLIILLQGFSVINYLASSVWMFITPLNKIFKIIGQEIKIVITPQVESLTKLFMLVPISFGLIIGIVILIYFINNKNYFQN